jgi:hypothetical protein
LYNSTKHFSRNKNKRGTQKTRKEIIKSERKGNTRKSKKKKYLEEETKNKVYEKED